MTDVSYPEWRWDRAEASVELSAGPDRVVTDQPAEGWRRAPLGFRPPVREVEPMLWEGDQA